MDCLHHAHWVPLAVTHFDGGHCHYPQLIGHWLNLLERNSQCGCSDWHQHSMSFTLYLTYPFKLQRTHHSCATNQSHQLTHSPQVPSSPWGQISLNSAGLMKLLVKHWAYLLRWYLIRGLIPNVLHQQSYLIFDPYLMTHHLSEKRLDLFDPPQWLIGPGHCPRIKAPFSYLFWKLYSELCQLFFLVCSDLPLNFSHRGADHPWNSSTRSRICWSILRTSMI